jgi:hypothetical protein
MGKIIIMIGFSQAAIGQTSAGSCRIELLFAGRVL